MNKKTTNKTKPLDLNHYHEEVTYDSKRENWSGVLSLLLIPLFIGVVGLGVVNAFRLPTRNDTGTGIESGIGGGAQQTVTPYKVPSITLQPGELKTTQGVNGRQMQGESLDFIQ